MNLEFDPIHGGQPVTVVLDHERYEAGAQGRVYRASLAGDHSYCVKALPGLSPGAAASEVVALSKLAGYIRSSASRPGLPLAVRKALGAVLSKLPTHTCMSYLDGELLHFLILRRFVEGVSLQRLTAPGAATPALGTRYEIARRLAGNLTALQLHGCVHLDPYPDNVLVDSDASGHLVEVALIDLEGVGAVARDPNGAVSRFHDSFAKEPGSYGKPGIWILPNWYPRPTVCPTTRPRPFGDMYIAASTWQMLCVILFALTWGLAPLAWLESISFQVIARAFSDSGITGAQIKMALVHHDQAALHDFEVRVGGNDELVRQMIRWFETGLVDPVAIPKAKDVQDCLASLCRA